MHGSAASASAQTRPKVHLPAHSAPRRPRHPPQAALGAEVQNHSLRPWCSGSSLRASRTKERGARRPEARKAVPGCTYSGHGLGLARSTSTRRREAAAYRDVRRASTRVARASEQCKNGGRAATLSPKSRPKVHLPVLRARARLDSHGDLRTKASGASGCTGLTGALRGVEQGAAIGFSMGASVFSHRLPSLRTHAPSRSPGSLILGVGGGHPDLVEMRYSRGEIFSHLGKFCLLQHARSRAARLCSGAAGRACRIVRGISSEQTS